MLLDESDPDYPQLSQANCPHCHLTGITSTLVFCPHCGWPLKRQAAHPFNLPVGCIVIGCLALGSFTGCALFSGPAKAIAVSDWSSIVFFGITVMPLIIYLVGRELLEGAQERQRKRDSHTVHISYDEEE